MRRAVGYVRVSTDRQADRGLGLEVQEAAIRRWASGSGWKLVAIHRDEGIAGTTDATDRPGLLRAVTDINDKRASALVVARMDRLARALTVQEAVLAEVWRRDGRIFSVDVGEVRRDDPDDPMLTFVRQVMGAAAQLERALVVARMRSGRRLKAERGGYAYGAPPYGYASSGGVLVPIESEQAALQRMRELRAQGRSLREIAKALTDEGYRPRRSATWHAESLRQLLARNHAQTGIPSWSATACKVAANPAQIDGDVVRRMRAMRDGGSTYRAIADRLTEDLIPAPRGGRRWWPQTVKLLCERDPL